MPTPLFIAAFFGVLIASGGAFAATRVALAWGTALQDPLGRAASTGTGMRATALGYPAPPEAAQRVIEINRGRKSVTVTNGETILFRVNGMSFAWTFDVTLDQRSFPLSKIAPEHIDVRGISVYCVPDLFERGD
jgi:hypothetical protein